MERTNTPALTYNVCECTLQPKAYTRVHRSLCVADPQALHFFDFDLPINGTLKVHHQHDIHVWVMTTLCDTVTPWLFLF